MRAQFKQFLIAFMILLLIGNTAAGATAVQSKQTPESNDKILTNVSLFAGSGDFDDADGAVLDATFRMPHGIVITEDGTVLVTDSKNHVIRQIKDGQVSTYAGMMLADEANGAPSGGWNDGAKETAVFNSPMGIDIDSEGNVYIADQENHSIRKITKDGTVSTIAGDGILGHEDGAGQGARFYKPQDVAVAVDGTLYVADTLNHVIRRITTDGQVTTLNAPSNRVVEVIPGYVVPAGDYLDGKLSDAKFNEPTSIAIDKKGNLYVSDTGNHVIRYIDMAKGTVSTVAGMPVLSEGALYGEGGYADGESSEARFHSPRGIAITDEGGLVIADSLNHTVRYLQSGQVSTIAGVPAQFGHVDGINGHNLLHQPSDVAVLPDGSLLITDSYNNKIRKLDFYKLPSNLPQNNHLKVVLENHLMSFDTKPEVRNDRTMIPVRALSEQMGYEVVFKANGQTIKLTKGDINIKMQIGSREISIENVVTGVKEKLEMDVAPYVKDERTYVPIRFFSEAFGMDVEWEHHTNSVILRAITEPVEKQPLANRYERTATLKEIKGTVWINQAGGSLTYRAYEGIIVRHGDHIVTEFNSSAVLVTADRDDEITIGETAKLYISNLSSASHVKHTSFHLWSGDVAASVTSLVDSNDTFKIITPTAVANVRGTHFIVLVDPITGMSSLMVNSGIVQGGVNGNNQNSEEIYPSQQLNIYPDTDDNVPGITYIDIEDFVNNASPDVIESILRNAAMIQQENEGFISSQEDGLNLSPEDIADINRVNNNLNNLIGNLVKAALDKGIIDEKQAKDLIDEINKELDEKIDLNNIPPLQLSDEERKKQEEAKKKEVEQKKKAEEQKRLKENQKQKQADLLAKLQAENERRAEENNRKLEEEKKKEEELFKQQLSDAEKQRFEQEKQKLEQQRQQQEAAQRPQPTPAPTPSLPEPPLPTPPVNRAPVVNNSIADRTVTTEDSIEINISGVFSDEDGDLLSYTVDSSNPAIAEARIEGELVIITQKSIGVTTIAITADDGKGGKAQVSFKFGVYGVIADLRAEASSNFIYLYWDPYGEYADGELEYHIYIDGEFSDSTNSNTMSFIELEPSTTYSLRVEALYRGDIIAFGDYDVTTMYLMDDNEPIELD